MSWFKLKEPMGSNYRVDPSDIVNTKQALNQLGHYDVPPHRGINDWTDDAMFSGIRSFQQENGLKVDGFMRPGGPTENAINARLADGNTDDQQVAFGGSLPDIILQRTSKGGGGNGGGRCYPDRGPGSNEDCDVLAEKDEQMCRSLPLPRLRKPCWESAAQRNAACKTGRPMPPLNAGDW